MARILVDGEWYNELAVDSLYETEFERMFVQEATRIFPDYWIVDFKVLVFSEYGPGKPDLALIHKQYTHWYVVEVEKSNHPFDGHVLEQARIFSTAEYHTTETIGSLIHKEPSLDAVKLNVMLRGDNPKVLIVVDRLKDEWMKSIRRWNAFLCVFQVFRSNLNRHIFRLNGQFPKTVDNVSSECYFHQTIKRYLIVESPIVLDVPSNGIVQMIFEDTISEWKRVDMSNKVALTPLSTNPLNIKTRYTLSKGTDGNYHLTC